MSNNEEDVDFSLLDSTVDELADLKAFLPLPKGSYLMDIKWDRKGINGMPAVILKMTVVDVVELTNKDEKCAAGDTTDIAFLLKKKDKSRNEVGEGQLKMVIAVLTPVFGGANIGETIAASDGGRIAVTLGQRQDKEDKEKYYNTLKAVAMPE